MPSSTGWRRPRFTPGRGWTLQLTLPCASRPIVGTELRAAARHLLAQFPRRWKCLRRRSVLRPVPPPRRPHKPIDSGRTRNTRALERRPAVGRRPTRPPFAAARVGCRRRQKGGTETVRVRGASPRVVRCRQLRRQLRYRRSAPTGNPTRHRRGRSTAVGRRRSASITFDRNQPRRATSSFPSGLASSAPTWARPSSRPGSSGRPPIS